MAARCCRADAGWLVWCLRLQVWFLVARFRAGAVPGTVRGRERGMSKNSLLAWMARAGVRGRYWGRPLEERGRGGTVSGGAAPGCGERGPGGTASGGAAPGCGERGRGERCLGARRRGAGNGGRGERCLGARRRGAGNGAWKNGAGVRGTGPGGTVSGGARRRGAGNGAGGNGVWGRGAGVRGTGPGGTVSGGAAPGCGERGLEERGRGARYGKGKPEQRQGIPVRMPGNSRGTEQ